MKTATNSRVDYTPRTHEVLIDTGQAMDELDAMVEKLYALTADKGCTNPQLAIAHALTIALNTRKRVTELLMGAR